MFRRLVFIGALFAFVTAPVPQMRAAAATISQSVVAQSMPALFDTEDAAQGHCPRDVVVWLNIPSGIYHYKGERWYGRTKHGAYACEKEAIRAGDRASENGQ
jgi:hypothetical protein